MIYRPKHFKLVELVCPKIYQARGERAWELLQVPALITLDQLRDKFGRILINNWHTGGQRDEAGLRTPFTSTGAEFSQHKFGGAFDPRPLDVTPQEMHAYILANQGEFPHITTLEAIAATPTWVHFDVRNNATPGIRVVNP